MKILRNNSGDTLVEVLLSTLIVSIVLAGAFTLSNRATRINQAAFERTTVSNRLQEQAELLRAARAADTATDSTEVWDVILGDLGTSASPPVFDCEPALLGNLTALLAANADSNAFHLSYDTSVNPAQIIRTPGHLQDGFYSFWIEGIAGAGSGYSDFIMHACWPGQGQNFEVTPGVFQALNNQSGIALRLENRQ